MLYNITLILVIIILSKQSHQRVFAPGGVFSGLCNTLGRLEDTKDRNKEYDCYSSSMFPNKTFD